MPRAFMIRASGAEDGTGEQVMRRSDVKLAALAACLMLAACGGGSRSPGPAAAAKTPEAALGQRLFRETRFAQFFAVNFGNDVIVYPPPADPVLAVTPTTTGALPGPLTGATMSCRGCHLHDEADGFVVDFFGGALRTFGDFASRSPIPLRGD